jgi:DNA polymerase-3 subunit gamma/tau
VAELEQVDIEPEALAVVARAAEGSARDGLSLLDQAIAHGSGRVTAGQVREMLGLADRGRIRRLLALLLAGDAQATLAELDEAHALGIDPTALLRGLMEQIHAASRAKAGGSGDVLASAEEREASAELAATLGWGALHRLWQLLLKGLADVGAAPDPDEAAAMVLLRIVHAADLPDPSALLAKLQGGGEAPGAARSAPAPRSAAAPAPAAEAPPAPPAPRMPADFPALVQLLEDRSKALRSVQLFNQVGLIRYAPPELILKPLQPLGTTFARELADDLKAVTGSPWQVTLGDGEAEPSLRQRQQLAEEQAKADILAEPALAAILAAYPDATLESVQNQGR